MAFILIRRLHGHTTAKKGREFVVLDLRSRSIWVKAIDLERGDKETKNGGGGGGGHGLSVVSDSLPRTSITHSALPCVAITNSNDTSTVKLPVRVCDSFSYITIRFPGTNFRKLGLAIDHHTDICFLAPVTKFTKIHRTRKEEILRYV